MKSKEVRESGKMLRNKYLGDQFYGIPDIKKNEFVSKEFKFMGFDRIGTKKIGNEEMTIHFFLDDNKFNTVYDNSHKHLERLARFYAVLTPDFSLYTDMPIALQIYNVFKNRWCGAFWQDYGLNVIPTVSWSDYKSYDFCFLGIERNSIVALSTLGVKKEKEKFMHGYNEMLERLSPEIILCYDKPFSEMKGNVIYIDYLKSTGRCA